MKNFVFVLMVCAIFLMPAVPSYALVMDLGASYDTTVMYKGSIDGVYYDLGAAADVNFDSAQTLLAYQFYENHASSFLQFNLTSLSGATVNAATLYLDVNGIGSNIFNTLTPQIGAHQVNTSWDSSLLTWNDVYTGNIWSPEIKSNFYTADPFDTDSWLSPGSYPGTMNFDMTGIVNGWLDGSLNNNGVAITGIRSGEPFGTVFYSSESATYPSHYPYLRVDYTLGGTDPGPNAVPEPSSIFLLSSGILGLMGLQRKRNIA